MDSLLAQVRGKIFSFCDTSTIKIVRLVSHSCALDVDVFTGLAIILDEDFLDSLKFAQSIQMRKITVRRLTSDIDLKLPQGEATIDDMIWLYNSDEFKLVHSVSLIGPIHWKWIQNSLQNFANLTSLHIGGPSLNYPIFPYNKKDILVFNNLRSFHISTAFAEQNLLHPSERRYIFSDSTASSDNDIDDYDENEKFYLNPYYSASDIEEAERGPIPFKKFDVTTPVADNVYQLLSLIYSPQLDHLRITYDEKLYNIGGLNWRDEPLRKFLQRHSNTLQVLILDGEQNDMENVTRVKSEIYPIPENLKYLFVSIVDIEKQKQSYNSNSGSSNSNLKNVGSGSGFALGISNFVVPFFKSVLRLATIEESRSLWKDLLRKQKSLESLHCTVHASWGWSIISKCIENSYSCLQVINLGCCWSYLDKPFNMEIISHCLFLKKFTFTSVTSTSTSFPNRHRNRFSSSSQKEKLLALADEYLESEKRCKIINFSALISCVMLESIFITCALCETSDLDILTNLPSLTCLVLMYVGKTMGHGVTVGLVEDLLHLRSLNLLIVVEFYRQKHSLNAYRLKKICQSEINTRNCPIMNSLVPYSGWGKYLYVGDIRELREVDNFDDFEMKNA